MSNNFENKPMPQAMLNVIRLRMIAGVLFLAIGVIMLFMKFPSGMYIPPMVISIVAFISRAKVRSELNKGTYKTYTGTVVDYEYTTPFKTKLKYIVFNSDGKRYKVSYGKRKVEIGANVTVYVPASTNVYEMGGYYNITQLYAISFK